MSTRGESSVFGKYLRELLIVKKMSLREVSRRSGIDASNLSKIERGVAYPPQKRATLERLSRALDLTAEEQTQFFDLAAQANGQLPPDLNAIRNNRAVPMLLRAINNRKLTHEQVVRLKQLIEEEDEWQGRVVD